MMRRTLIALLFLGCSAAIFAQSSDSARGPSTKAERDRAVQVAQKLEARPLDPALKADSEWLFKWISDIPDITVNICANPDELSLDYKYRSQLEFQKMASAVAFLIQHPDNRNDRDAQELAGVQGALVAYRNILKSNPRARSRYWDDLLQRQKDGTLKSYISKYVSEDCTAPGTPT